MAVLDEVLSANEQYAASFGAKSELALPRPAASRSSPAWMLGSILRSTTDANEVSCSGFGRAMIERM